MPSIKQIFGVVTVGLATVATALPAMPKLNERALKMYTSHLMARQDPATGLPDGLGDVDILQFALTLEYLETAFYTQGFNQFSDSDFTALGLSTQDITNLKSIGSTEQTHVTTLLTAIASAGTKPVAPCTYDFKLTDAASMVATASILENVGVSAYLGAAPLIQSAGILSVAAQIVTVESRHQTFIRTASKVAAVPSAFDTALGVRSVFTLAAGFITSCPNGSNLAVTPFTGLTMTGDAKAAAVAGATVQLSTTATGGTFCSFTNGGLPGGSAFTAFANGACTTPSNLAGETYVHITSSAPASNTLIDSIIVAGPMVMTVS